MTRWNLLLHTEIPGLQRPQGAIIMSHNSPSRITIHMDQTAKCWLLIPPPPRINDTTRIAGRKMLIANPTKMMINDSHFTQITDCKMLIVDPPGSTIDNSQFTLIADCRMLIVDPPRIDKKLLSHFDYTLATLNSLTVWCLPVWKLVHNILIVKTCFLYFNWDIWATYCHLFQEER